MNTQAAARIFISLIVGTWTLGCAAKADKQQIDGMCQNLLMITGVSKITDEAIEVARIEKEYAAKEKKLRDEIDRDIKGQEDVYAQRLSELEKNEIELSKDEKKARLTKEKKKEALKEKYIAEYEKNKQGFEEEFKTLFEKIGPRRDREIEKARIYIQDRKAKADKEMATCVGKAKSDRVCAEVAGCRTAARSKEQYDSCE